MINESREESIVSKYVDMIGEHFDNVQVFASRYDHDTKSTVCVSIGSGNYTARIGQITLWLNGEVRDITEGE